MIVYDAKGKIITLGESIGRGGEAVVYAVKGREDSLAKIYTPAPRPDYPEKLAWMVSHAPGNPTGHLAHASLAWPEGLLYDSHRRLVGYKMPHIRGAALAIDVFNPRRRAKILPGFDRRYLHRTARNLTACLQALHGSGYAAGDLNESNVMVTPSALVTLIDTDSFQVVAEGSQGPVLHPCPVGKPEYTPPELQGKPAEKVLRLPEHDLFALAVLIFQLLVEGSHPFRAQWLGSGDPAPIENRIAQGLFPYGTGSSRQVRPPLNSPGLDSLHPELVELFRRCFTDGHRDPRQRPTPSEWGRALEAAENSLVGCRQGHLYASHLATCPYCRPVEQRTRARPAQTPRQRQPAAGPRPRPQGQGARPFVQTAARMWNWYQVSRAPARRWTWPNPPSPYPASAPAPSSRPAPSMGMGSASPAANRPGMSRPVAWSTSVQQWQQAMQPAEIWRWARPRLSKSLLLGGGTGILAGGLAGALAAVASGAGGEMAAWSLLWALGGAAAGVLRGWHPGYQLGLWIERTIGWRRVWQIAGLLGGAALGALFGFAIGWWAIIPIFIGLFLGARKGVTLGSRIWLYGARLGWNRILTVTGGVGAALVGWQLASWAGSSGLGVYTDELAGELSTWLAGNSLNSLAIWGAVGALGGALGGAVSGIFTDLFARLSGLVD